MPRFPELSRPTFLGLPGLLAKPDLEYAEAIGGCLYLTRKRDS